MDLLKFLEKVPECGYCFDQDDKWWENFNLRELVLEEILEILGNGSYVISVDELKDYYRLRITYEDPEGRVSPKYEYNANFQRVYTTYPLIREMEIEVDYRTDSWGVINYKLEKRGMLYSQYFRKVRDKNKDWRYVYLKVNKSWYRLFLTRGDKELIGDRYYSFFCLARS